MFEPLKGWLLRALRVPAEPRPAASDTKILRIFRAAPNFWRYKLVLWGARQFGAACGLIIGLSFARATAAAMPFDNIRMLIMAFEALAIITFLAQLPLSYALLRLDFDMRWYILTDRSMHLREGTLRLTEQTITFANIQQISIQQNPLQRVLGLADVNVRTAGGGESQPAKGNKHGGGMHEARFHGVNNAEEIRDAIRERVRLHRDAGLGDSDEPEPHAAAEASSDAVLAARAVLHEVRALRAASSL